MSDAIDVLLSPIGFSEGILGLPLYDWQDRLLAPLEFAAGHNLNRVKIAGMAPNGAGKDQRVIGPATLYWPFAHPRGKVVITSKDSKQINEQTVPAIESHLHKFEGWTAVHSPYFKVTTPTGGSIHAFTTDDPSRLEGWHKEDDINGPLLFIVNEAKSLPEAMFQAIDRCGWNVLMLLSSGGMMTGRFFDAFHKHAQSYNRLVRAGLKDCPHIPEAKVKDIIATYGEQHPFTRSSIYGEFMQEDNADKLIISRVAVLNCINNAPKHRPGFRAWFCDFGGNNAEHVIAGRDGNKRTIEAAFREANKMAAVGRFIHHFRRLGAKPEEITGDAADKELLDLLAEAGWPINRQNFGAPPRDKHHYKSWGSEAWHKLAADVVKCDIILPDDEILVDQLSNRERDWSRDGKLGMKHKFLMQIEDGLVSPDRGDAIAGVNTVPDHSNLNMQKAPWESWKHRYEREDNERVLQGMGADVGL